MISLVDDIWFAGSPYIGFLISYGIANFAACIQHWTSVNYCCSRSFVS